ncbi:MAG: ATPase domain-containing protein [Gemmatimonadaceae bacterium]
MTDRTHDMTKGSSKDMSKNRTDDATTSANGDDTDGNDSNDSSDLLHNLATGIPGLDSVLGGGLPEYSFNIIAGVPGAGKTTMAQQIVFANATVERPALYFTVLGESTLKMIRYQRRFRFFKPELVGTAVRFINLSAEVLGQDLNQVLARIITDVERYKPKIVVLDSFRTINLASNRQYSTDAERAMGLEQFIQNLALQLTTWEVTSFLIGEYNEQESRSPVFTVADGILWLAQATDRNSVVRKFQATKIRGQGQMPGLHTFRITRSGVEIFPRIPEQQMRRKPRPQVEARLKTGIPGLDEMMGGGIPAGDAVLLTGPAGSGKTTFATQFVAEGIRAEEKVVVVVFEEYPEEYLSRARVLDMDLEEQVRLGNLGVIYLRPLDLSVDETLADISSAVKRLGATRVVIDSLSGFQVALAPTFREDFQESLYRLVGALTATGITVMMTAEIVENSNHMQFTGDRVSFITDDIIMQRYVEIEGDLKKVLAVVKMRGSAHSAALRSYEITATGAVMNEFLKDYRGILTGVPSFDERSRQVGYAGLTEREASVLETLVRLRSASVELLATHTAVPVLDLEQALARFVELDYAIRLDAGGEITYRALARLSDK